MYYRQTIRREIVSGVQRIEDSFVVCIPFDPANTDFQTFKVDVTNGVELQDPEGNVMTQEQVDEFLRTIP